MTGTRAAAESLRMFRHVNAMAAAAGWARALCWAQWAPPSRPGGAWLTLGIGPGLAPREWPRQLRLHPRGESLPVRCVAAAQDGCAHAWLRLRNAEHDFGRGTVGGFLRTPDARAPLLALTAGHVLAGSGLAQVLDPVDFSVDGATLGSGRLHGWTPRFGGDGEDTALDVGAVRLDGDAARRLLAQAPLPLGTAGVQEGQPVRLLTRGRGPVAGRAKGLLTAFMRVGDDDALRYQLVQGLCFDLDGGSQPGDSGAALWDSRDRQVALHAGAAPEGSAGNAIATPIARVLNWFGGELVTRSGAAATPPPAAALRVSTLPPAGAVPPPAGQPLAPESARAIEVLARTLWGEARGEREAGMEAVAHVVFNRRDARRWWGASVEAVCQKPFQFSCWNEGTASRRSVLGVTRSDAGFVAALGIAQRLAALSEGERARADTTGGATHYHVAGLSPLPNWAVGRPTCARIGRHVFYRGIA